MKMYMNLLLHFPFQTKISSSFEIVSPQKKMRSHFDAQKGFERKIELFHLEAFTHPLFYFELYPHVFSLFSCL